MINLLTKEFMPSLLLYSILHISLFSILITQYYTKILEHIFLYFNISNIYKVSLLHTMIMNIPRVYLMINTEIYKDSTLINGFNALYLSLGMGLIIVNAHLKTFLHFECFLKDLFALIGGLALQGLSLNGWRFDFFQVYTAFTLFLIFIYLTCRLKYIERREPPRATPRMPFLYLKKINTSFTRHVYDFVILNLESFHKQSVYTSLQILCSPVINMSLFLLYFKPINTLEKKLLSLLISFLIGLVLIKTSKKQHFQIVNYFYGLGCTLFYTTISIDRMRLLIDRSCIYLKKGFLYSTMLPLIIGLPEFLHLIYHSKRTKSSMALCGIINSTIFTTLCLGPLKRYFDGIREDSLYKGDQVSLSFGTISLAVTFFNYIMKNQKFSKDLGYILLIIYLLYILTFLLDYKKFIKIS